MEYNGESWAKEVTTPIPSTRHLFEAHCLFYPSIYINKAGIYSQEVFIQRNKVHIIHSSFTHLQVLIDRRCVNWVEQRSFDVVSISAHTIPTHSVAHSKLCSVTCTLPDRLCKLIPVCDGIWKLKAPSLYSGQSLFLIMCTCNFKGIIAKTMYMYGDSSNTRCKIHTTPTSGIGLAIMSISHYASFWSQLKHSYTFKCWISLVVEGLQCFIQRMGDLRFPNTLMLKFPPSNFADFRHATLRALCPLPCHLRNHDSVWNTGLGCL